MKKETKFKRSVIRRGFMFDTNCFHNIKNEFVDILNRDENLYYVTDIQYRELEESLDERVNGGTLTKEGKEGLLQKFKKIEKYDVQLKTGILGHSEAATLGKMSVGTAELFEKLKEGLTKIKKEENNFDDALIIEAAIKENLIFVTNENKIIKLLKELYPENIMSFKNFKEEYLKNEKN